MEGIIDFNDWAKIDLRVAQIKEVEEIEGLDKIYKIRLDVGGEIGERVVCAGLKPYYGKEELIGKKIIVFVNLNPRKIKGIESQGMLLAAVNNEEEKVILLTPEKDIELGSKIQ